MVPSIGQDGDGADVVVEVPAVEIARLVSDLAHFTLRGLRGDRFPRRYPGAHHNERDSISVRNLI